MAKYTPSQEEQDLYTVKPPKDAAAPGGAPDAAAPKEAKEAETTDQEIEESQHSAVVPNNVLMGPDGTPPKEGDEIVVKVVKVYGNESEIIYGPPKGAEKETNHMPESDMMAGANSEIEALDEKGT